MLTHPQRGPGRGSMIKGNKEGFSNWLRDFTPFVYIMNMF